MFGKASQSRRYVDKPLLLPAVADVRCSFTFDFEKKTNIRGKNQTENSDVNEKEISRFALDSKFKNSLIETSVRLLP